MNKKLTFFSVIVAIAAVSVGTLTYSTLETEAIPQMIQTKSSAMIDAPLEMIAGSSKYVIVGEVLNIKPVVYIDTDRAVQKTEVESLVFKDNMRLVVMEKEILSDVTIKVEEDLFGKYNEKLITVRVPGGEIPTQKTIHDQSPTFVIGERVILFVGNGQSYDISADNYTVLGLEQGTIKLGEKVESKFANDNTTESKIKNQIKSLS